MKRPVVAAKARCVAIQYDAHRATNGLKASKRVFGVIWVRTHVNDKVAVGRTFRIAPDYVKDMLVGPMLLLLLLHWHNMYDSAKPPMLVFGAQKCSFPSIHVLVHECGILHQTVEATRIREIPVRRWRFGGELDPVGVAKFVALERECGVPGRAEHERAQIVVHGEPAFGVLVSSRAVRHVPAHRFAAEYCAGQ